MLMLLGVGLVSAYYDVGEEIPLPYLTTEEYSDFDYSDGEVKYVYCNYEFDSPDDDKDIYGMIPLSENQKCIGGGIDDEDIKVILVEGTSTLNLVISKVGATYVNGTWIPGEAVIIDSLNEEYSTIIEPDEGIFRTIMMFLLDKICEIYPFGSCGY